MNEPWWRTLGRITFWLMSRILFPLAAIGVPALIIYGALHPRTDDYTALRLEGREVALLIGTGGGDVCDTSRTRCSRTFGRTYLVVPRVFLDGSEYQISEAGGNISVTTAHGAALMFLGYWALGIWCVWKYWIHPLASNYRLERP